jgi:murein DD-endopeptidase MepM/ murein hydrolase activator NlpD
LTDRSNNQTNQDKPNWIIRLGSRPGTKKILLVCVPIIVILTFISQARCAVVLGNEVVAVAPDRRVAEAAVEEYFTRLERITGMPVKVKGEIKYRPVWKFGTVAGKEEIQRNLAAKVDCRYEATGIFADGKMIAAVKDAKAAKKVLDTLLHTYDNDGAWKVSFKQKVELKPVEVAGPDLMDPEEAVEYIRFGGTRASTYEIKEGDTLWDIAAAVHLPVDKLLQANPELNPETMQIGQQIKISQTCPLVDVISTYRDTRREEILYRVQERVDDSLYLGERKLVQRGKPGEREVVYNVALENGVEVKREVIKQKIITEPVPQIIAKGSRKLLAFRGGNSRLAYPTVGAITSPFGNRHGRLHRGVDIAANYGSPVVAAEAGTVLRAGYRGAYGLCIDISHGGGVVTRYAHLSSAAVKPGQRVERGQFIGRTGSSGNSTGPHLHFEVIVNGEHKNPSLFI